VSQTPRILLIGTADTKSDELLYLRERVQTAGGEVILMDVGVLAGARFRPDISNIEVARAAGTDLQALRESGDENLAMQAMAAGATALSVQAQQAGRIDGVLMLGGSMGTDLALDVAAALPLGVPKVVLSTVAHSHLIAPERVCPDLTMMLWAGGLYGLNPVCKAILSQAAGAVVGACLAAEAPASARPLVGVTSFGSSCLRYMTALKPALESRGYDVAVFHTTGMGGRAFESMAGQGLFAAVFDFSLQEISNHYGGSCVSAGPDRLRGAGNSATAQLVAPGAIDMIDFPAWGLPPAGFEDRPSHVHNRLIASATLDAKQRADVAALIVSRLSHARGPTCLLLPQKGLHAWDLPNQPLHDSQALAASLMALRQGAEQQGVKYLAIDSHINDEAFVNTALAQFDDWVAQGLVAKGQATPAQAQRAEQ
jgi:uncharacterized protein (UPF0261 family)